MNHTPDYIYKATLVRIVDGDTVVLSISCGFFIDLAEQKLRLAGINAPEINTPEGVKAKQALIDFIGSKPLVIQTKKDSKDKYGRWLATIWVQESDGTETDVNQAMLDSGQAVKM